MESVHKTYRRPWISEKLSVREFKDEAYKVVSERCHIMKELYLSLDERMLGSYKCDECKSRSEAISVRLLDCENEERIELSKRFEYPRNNDLEILKRQAEEMQKRNNSVTYRNMVFQSSRYAYYSSSMEVVTKRRHCNESETEFRQIEHPECILTVQIYRPEKEQIYQQPKASRTPLFKFSSVDSYERKLQFSFRIHSSASGVVKVDQQFMVLGSQYLTEVRDLICCQSDAAVVGEFSDNPECSANFACQEMYRSGFFYINDTFYNDMRDPMNKDYSKPIIEWSAKSAHDIGPFTVAKMEETKFVDLEIQLGLPYVYQHQGHCEHMIVFSELRLMDSKDSQDVNDYPLVQLLQPKKPTHCMACLLYTAKWITTDDPRMPELPYFMCDKCFKIFNYDEDDEKVEEFKAYKFFDKTAIF